jgi:uncharacterized protein
MATERLLQRWVKARNPAGDQVGLAVKDGFKRLMKPSLETEFRVESKLKADAEAIRIFCRKCASIVNVSTTWPEADPRH